PEHLSWYQLTLEPNTLFHARPPPLPDDEQKWAMQQQGLQLLEQQGYEQYEVSAFARQGRRCAHNLNYWRYGDYIGIGAGAHGKITLAGEGTIVRSARRRHPADYLAGAGTPAGIESRRRPGAEETAFEYALNRLRLRAGFDLEEFETRCGLQRRHILPAIEAAAGKGLLRLQGERVEHSERGWRFLDDLLQEFLPRSLSE
ncbi:MAG TPA: hypothetical protein ENK05_02465, partial [Gammaproteobacteria bacterium]|nr:hypothetical protein [Gammaproteobacteria bacterium]